MKIHDIHIGDKKSPQASEDYTDIFTCAFVGKPFTKFIEIDFLGMNPLVLAPGN